MVTASSSPIALSTPRVRALACAGSRSGSGPIDEFAKPQLEHEKGPNTVRGVAVAVHRFDQTSHLASLEQSPLAGRSIQENVSDQFAEVVFHPSPKRQTEA